MSAPTPDPVTLAEATRAFGRHLLRERELRGLTAEEVVTATRLAPAVIEAIEAGDPERMPPRGYLVGYLRSYAAAVGLDADDVVLRYQEFAGVEDPEPPPGAARAGARSIAGQTPQARRRILVAVTVVVLLAAAVAIGSRRGGSGEVRGRKSAEKAPYRPSGSP